MPRGRGYRGAGYSSPRRTFWSATTPAAFTLPDDTSLILAIFNPSEAPETLIRTRGEFTVYVDTSTIAVGEAAMFGFGIGMVTEAAATVGVGSVPTPLTDADWDGWLYHRFVGLGAETTVASDDEGLHMARVVVDSKAMRKVDTDQRLVIVAENIGLVGAFTMQGTCSLRLLSKTG